MKTFDVPSKVLEIQWESEAGFATSISEIHHLVKRALQVSPERASSVFEQLGRSVVNQATLTPAALPVTRFVLDAFIASTLLDDRQVAAADLLDSVILAARTEKSWLQDRGRQAALRQQVIRWTIDNAASLSVAVKRQEMLSRVWLRFLFTFVPADAIDPMIRWTLEVGSSEMVVTCLELLVYSADAAVRNKSYLVACLESEEPKIRFLSFLSLFGTSDVLLEAQQLVEAYERVPTWERESELLWFAICKFKLSTSPLVSQLASLWPRIQDAERRAQWLSAVAGPRGTGTD